MRVEGKLSKETMGTKGRGRGEKMEQERAREDEVNVDMHLHESKSLHVPRVLNIYSENSFKGTKSCLPSANSSSPYAFRDPFLPLYLCDCLSPCICLSTSASLPRSGCHVRGCRGSKHRGVVRGFLQCGYKAKQQSSWWLPLVLEHTL